jgi:hypothetical protein
LFDWGGEAHRSWLWDDATPPRPDRLGRAEMNMSLFEGVPVDDVAAALAGLERRRFSEPIPSWL